MLRNAMGGVRITTVVVVAKVDFLMLLALWWGGCGGQNCWGKVPRNTRTAP